MSVKTNAMSAFDKIGRTGNTACPDNQDPLVSVAHEYHVCTMGESYFKKRREDAKKKLVSSMSPKQSKELVTCVAGVKQNEVADTITLAETAPYIVAVDVKNGASFVDMAALKVTMARKLKLKMTEVEAIIEECTDRREPAQSWKIIER